MHDEPVLATREEPVSATRYFALFAGMVLFLLGFFGLAHLGVSPMHATEYVDLRVRLDHSYLFGEFPANIFTIILFLGLGVLGMAVYGVGYQASRAYSEALTLISAVLAIMGMLPVQDARTFFGLMPVYGNDVWLFVTLAVLGFIFGFTSLADATDVPVTITDDVDRSSDLFNSGPKSV
jgi:hypothetical protein